MSHKKIHLSLASKCQILFGAAVILILMAALGVVWLRLDRLVQETQQEAARQLAVAWLNGKIEPGSAFRDPWESLSPKAIESGLTLSLIGKEDFDWVVKSDPFLAQAINRFQTRDDALELFAQATDGQGQPYYRYVRAIRKSDLLRSTQRSAQDFSATLETPGLADPLTMVLLLQHRGEAAGQQIMLNRLYLIAAGLLAGLLAIAAFWFITMRLILSPVRVLRDTAEKIGQGDLNILSDINTGDEFEQLSDTFNRMVLTLKESQQQLRVINKSLDLKLDEMSKSNTALNQANKVKGEFLANVSHELRTPLNSIIGFAEVLQETLADRTGPVDEKRKRYVQNIITSSRRLLDLINDLLDLAKIEAGRLEVRLGPMSIADTAEGLANLIRPQADKKSLRLELALEANLPLVQTDAGKFQQVIFNFLSNAVKFSPEGSTVTLRAKRIDSPDAGASPRFRVSVTDQGPGIPKEMHEKIFEKFTQLDQTMTKEHVGTGLGLSISKELSKLLQGQIDVESEVGQGATFSLTIPLALDQRPPLLMPPSPPPISPPISNPIPNPIPPAISPATSPAISPPTPPLPNPPSSSVPPASTAGTSPAQAFPPQRPE